MLRIRRRFGGGGSGGGGGGIAGVLIRLVEEGGVSFVGGHGEEAVGSGIERQGGAGEVVDESWAPGMIVMIR